MFAPVRVTALTLSLTAGPTKVLRLLAAPVTMAISGCEHLHVRFSKNSIARCLYSVVYGEGFLGICAAQNSKRTLSTCLFEHAYNTENTSRNNARKAQK